MNGSSRLDLLVNDRYGERRGVFWLENTGTGEWPEHPICGAEDEVLFLTRGDLDGDGDLDVITCEETEGLGLVWYENPAR
jgi:hypothetical protein